jgi:hypothetical protein
LQELLKRLQDRHVDCAEAVAKEVVADVASASTVSPDTPSVMQAMMKLEQVKARAKTANKVALEAEKEKDAAEKSVEELKRQLQPKRARTDDDAGDAHDLFAEFDNCDLSDHRREGTRVQNRRNVQVGSHDNQQKPLTGKDGFLHHTRLGLVGWISYWCCGDSEARENGIRYCCEGAEKGLARGGAYRLAKCGQLRWRLTCGLDTFGSASSGRFLVV